MSISVSPLRMDDETDRHVHHVGAEPLAGELERGLGAGRDLEEEIDLGAPAQRRALLLDLAVEIDEFLGEIEEAEISARESPSIPNRCRLLRTNEGFGAMVIKARPIGATGLSGRALPADPQGTRPHR